MNCFPEESCGDRLSGLIERVTFYNPANGYSVLKVKVPGIRGLVTVTGKLSSAHPGQVLEARGSWGINPRHGRQFKAVFLSATTPETVEGMKKYLGSGLVQGIGSALADRLVSAFGDRVFEIIEQQPARLTEVEGIGAQRQEMIVSAWHRQRLIRGIMVFLHSHEISTSRAFRILRAYGPQAVEVIRQDPYRLARDIRGIGFLSADRIASSLGVESDSPLRRRAGLEHILLLQTEEGHCAVERKSLIVQTASLLKISLASVEQTMGELIKRGRLICRHAPEGEELIFLPSLDAAELGTARRLAAIQKSPHPCPPIMISKAIQWVQKRESLELSREQKQALARACCSPVIVITGGPGVGKTTLISSLVQIFQAKGLKVALGAPTGRAARKMTQSTGLPAQTLHRLLEFDPHRGIFTRGRSRPLTADIFIVDEFSMVDIFLAESLLEAVPDRAALILVGDVDQLPSVGPGRVLKDLIDSKTIPVARLETIFRQADRSLIVKNAHRVNQGLLPVAAPAGEKSDYHFIECENAPRAARLICELVSKKLPRQLKISALKDIQVLTPMRKGELGVNNLNICLQQELNPGEGGVESLGLSFRIGDRVMQVVNDYEKDVFNGDIGQVIQAEKDTGQVVVDFDGRLARYGRGDLDDLTLSYAISIHKSQGSEYPVVVIPLHTQHFMLLRRNLIYTAITRGSRFVVVVGSNRALKAAVSRKDSRIRVSMLETRLTDVWGK